MWDETLTPKYKYYLMPDSPFIMLIRCRPNAHFSWVNCELSWSGQGSILIIIS